MPKSYTVQHVAAWQPQQFILDGDQVVGFMVAAELNFGSFSQVQVIDIWEFLTDQEKQAVQGFRDRIQQGLKARYLE